MENSSEAIRRHAETRKRYQKILDEANEYKEIMGNEDRMQNIKKIETFLRECDDIQNSVTEAELVHSVPEINMDSQVLKLSHNLMIKLIKSANTEFSEQEFSNAIAALVFKDGEDNWNVIADISRSIAKPSKFSSCLLGSFEHEPAIVEKVVKERQKRNKTLLEKEQKPEQVERLDKQDKGVQKFNIMHKQIKALYNKNHNTPIPFYKLILDPNDFMHSVDNALQVAFLAKDGMIVFGVGSDGYPTIRPSNQAEKNIKDNLVHNCMRLDWQTCQDMCSFYKIEEPLIVMDRMDH